MAVLDNNFPTIADVGKLMDGDGKVNRVIEILTSTDSILDDIPWMPSSKMDSHVTTLRAGLPSPSKVGDYDFVKPTKGTTVQMPEQMGRLESWCEIDERLVQRAGEVGQELIVRENTAHMLGLKDELANELFKGNTASDPNGIDGFATRFSAKTGQPYSDNVIDNAESASPLSSIWLVGWGPMTVSGVYPKNTPSGLQVDSYGIETVEGTHDNGANAASAPGRMRAHRTRYSWNYGLSIMDWRYLVRIANVDQSPTLSTANAQSLMDNLFMATERLGPMGTGGGVRAAWYASRRTITRIRQSMSRLVSGSTLQMEDVGGKKVETFLGFPLRRVDKLAIAESAI